jgi:hypothetical protein
MDTRADTIRDRVLRLVRQSPFQPFVLGLENGQQVQIDHPENIAFDPASNGSRGSPYFHVVAGDLMVISTFEAVTTVVLVDARSRD